MRLTPQQKEAFIEHVLRRTNPIKPHEADILATILKLDFGKHDWRFKRHVLCEVCRRELTVLDYFLASLRHHDADFIRRQIMQDEGDAASANKHKPDAQQGTHRIEIVDHAITIACITCGFEFPPEVSGICHIYLYKHPGKLLPVIRVSRAEYESIIKEMGLTE